MRLVLDVENDFTIIQREGKSSKNDALPFSGRNNLVTVGIKDIDTQEVVYEFFHHDEVTYDPDVVREKVARIQSMLDKASLIIGHFVKHDVIWMAKSGFKIPRTSFWDTAIAEYVMHRGQTHPLSLKELAIKHDLPRKKSDLVQEYWDKGITTSKIPKGVLEEYGIGDLNTTEALFNNQTTRLQLEDNKVLVPTITMMNDFMYVLSRWQSNGIKIDRKELEKVRAEYVFEQQGLRKRLEEIAREYMGDTPFSLTSPEDMSILIYSRRLTDKKKWKATFNIGTDEKGKSLRRPRMKPHEFATKVRELTTVEYRTTAAQCQPCAGLGRVLALKKDGTQGKAKRICKPCSGCGVIYTNTKRVAGFKFSPTGVKDTSSNGFVTDADTLERLSGTATGAAKEFLDKITRLHAVNVYISTFCDGILTNLTKDDFLYTNFNQCITATGRLSSTDPNFQNQPRGKTFPVRRAIISRFPGGSIIEGDFAQLEFRVAGELSDDEQVLWDILNGVDAHAFTRDTLNAAGLSVDRQDAKPHTFKPLYGGEYGTPAEMAYYAAFKAKFKGVARWQRSASELVLSRKLFTLPTGRQYCWPRCERKWNGSVDFFTQIVNYPVQGFATADIVPLACILLDQEFERRGLRSVAFLTVHDSIAVDAFPGEEAIATQLLADCMLGVKQELLRRYEYHLKMPLEVEIKMGYNWLDTKVVKKAKHEYVQPKPANDFIDDSLPDFMVA